MMDDKQLQIDVSRFPLKHETFERKHELGDKLVRLRAVSRHAEVRRRNVAIAFSSAVLAAAVVLAAVFMMRVSTIGSGSTATLPCGSVVAVGQGGNVKYRPFLWRFGHRVVELAAGSARFSVVSGQGEFSVETGFGSVSVLGTEFEVCQQDSVTAMVRCFSGKVAVNVDGAAPVEVEAGEETVVTGDVIAPVRALGDNDDNEEIEVNEEPETIIYDNEPLATIVGEMEVRFGITIDGKELCQGITYSGAFYTGDMDLTLKMVFGACGLDYVIEGNQVALRKNE